MVLLFYTIYISVGLAHHEIFRTKVGKDGITLGNIFTPGDRHLQLQQNSFRNTELVSSVVFFLFCFVCYSLRPINNLGTGLSGLNQY